MADFQNEKDDYDYEETDNNCTVFVGNIPYRVKWRELKSFLSEEFGPVRNLKCIKHVVTRRFLGSAFVRFESEESASEAISALQGNAVKLYGRLLRGGYPRQNRKQQGNTNSITHPENDTEVGDRVENDSSSPVSNLNEDCLTHILTYLDPFERIKVEKVCKQWKRCAILASKHQKNLVIRNPRAGVFGNSLPESTICRLIARNSNGLVSLDLSNVYSKVRKSAVETIASCCSKLEKLDISRSQVSNHGIAIIVEKCTRIKWLKVGGCSRITEKGFWSIFNHCKQLETLICSANKFTGNCLKIIPVTLKEIHLKNCELQRQCGVFDLSHRCRQLTILNLNNCKIFMMKSVTDIFKYCTHLEDVNIGHMAPQETSGGGVLYPHGHPVLSLTVPENITRLMIDNTGLCNSDLQFVCSRCVNLLELDISCNQVDDTSVSQLSTLTKLESLHICHMLNVTETALKDLITRGKLKCLRMQGLKLSDDGLFELMAMSCTMLEELDVAGVEQFTPRALDAFNRALSGQSDRKLTLYARNLYLDETSSVPVGCPANMQLRIIYRRLYSTHMRWVMEWEHQHRLVRDAERNDDLCEQIEELDRQRRIRGLAQRLGNQPAGEMDELEDWMIGELRRMHARSGGLLNGGGDAAAAAMDNNRQDQPAMGENATGNVPVQGPAAVADNEGPSPPVMCGVPVDLDDWGDDLDYYGGGCYHGDDYYDDDEFLVNDDALEQERWDLS